MSPNSKAIQPFTNTNEWNSEASDFAFSNSHFYTGNKIKHIVSESSHYTPLLKCKKLSVHTVFEVTTPLHCGKKSNVYKTGMGFFVKKVVS